MDVHPQQQHRRYEDVQETLYGDNGLVNRLRDLEVVTYGREKTQEAGSISRLNTLDGKVSEMLRRAQAQKNLLVGVTIGTSLQLLESTGILPVVVKFINSLLQQL